MAYGLKYNPFVKEELQWVTKNDFLPWAIVPAGVSVEISANREMIVTEEFVVLGELVVLGSLTLLSQSLDDSPSLNTYIGHNTQDVLDRLFGASESTAVSYNGDGTINVVTGYASSSQTTANRLYSCTYTYDASLYPATTTLRHYSTTDGTTVLKTIVVTYTWSSGQLITTTQVTS